MPDGGPANVEALEALVDAGDDMALVGPHMPRLGSRWETIHASELTQMVREERAPLAEDDLDVVALGPGDVDEMLALVALTQPGPFRARTIELGRFIGIRERGALAAMAGERTWIGDWREVSGVCTHPDAQGRGYARALIARVVNRMLRARQTPFLHVESVNARAIDVYRGLGFAVRTCFPLFAARRLG